MKLPVLQAVKTARTPLTRQFQGRGDPGSRGDTACRARLGPVDYFISAFTTVWHVTTRRAFDCDGRHIPTVCHDGLIQKGSVVKDQA
jgi:hypothetical protein